MRNHATGSILDKFNNIGLMTIYGFVILCHSGASDLVKYTEICPCYYQSLSLRMFNTLLVIRSPWHNSMIPRFK